MAEVNFHHFVQITFSFEDIRKPTVEDSFGKNHENHPCPTPKTT